MSLLDKLSNNAKEMLLKSAVNWEALKIVQEISRLERRLDRLQNPKNLMEWAVISSNEKMLGEYRQKVEKIENEISSLEEELEEVKSRVPDKKPEGKTPYEGVDFPPTDLDEFDFADDLSMFASIAEAFDRRHLFAAADVIDEFIQKSIDDLDKPHKRMAKVIRESRKRKLAQVSVEQLAQTLRLNPNVLKSFTPQQLSYLARIRNIGLARQWVTKFQLDNQRARALPTQPQKPMQMPSRQRDQIPAPLSKRDIPGPLTKDDIPGPLTEKDLFGR